MDPKTLFDLLLGLPTDLAIISYPANDTRSPRRLPYADLQELFRRKALQICALPGYQLGAVILLHFDDHLDNIVWFWATLFAGCIPALSTPLASDASRRRQHLEHLARLFEQPLCLTTAKHYDMLAESPLLDVHHITELATLASASLPALAVQPDDLAALMLTSGSTGLCKAVRLTHGQILSSLKGKSTATDLPHGHNIMNWVGVDHVAGLAEAHLLALFLRRDQVHVQPADMIAEPLTLVKMVTKHNVGRTFAPNFFLSSLLKAIQRSDSMQLSGIDLSCLRQIVSGGEANLVELCIKLGHALQGLGSPGEVICPAFGMTETCAGSIYNLGSPVVDVSSGRAFASLGLCVPGIQMRIASTDAAEVPGMLQVKGSIVTKGYHNNTEATEEAFTEDGWFITGDEAVIDDAGYLHIVGRLKDQVRINGLPVGLIDLEAYLNSASIAGAVDSFYVTFGFRRAEDATERLAVCYLPDYEVNDQAQRIQTNAAIATAVMQHSAVPSFILPLDRAHLEKTTLGKISRAKVKTAFLEGKLEEFEIRNDEIVSSVAAEVVEARTATEAQLLEVFRRALCESLQVPEYTIGVTTHWSSLGITSVQLILLKKRIELALGLLEVPLLWLMTNSTVENLALTLESSRIREDIITGEPSNTVPPNSNYSPVVKLRSEGTKPPIWLFHPGVGEVLVFVNLARHIEDRPVYALRARGFEQGETFFSSIKEAVETYYQAIKAVQPNGPYALAGYSYGAMLAFETAKRLENVGDGQKVGFLASFNLPPHIKFRMNQLDWTACACHLAHFLGLVHDPDTSGNQQSMDRSSTLQYIFNSAPPDRLAELALSQQSFAHWADLAHSMQSMARSYEPGGLVRAMDVFYCTPLAVVAQSKPEWLQNHLSRWSEVCPDVRFHEVDGEHYTMIDAEHVEGFQHIFQTALLARGM